MLNLSPTHLQLLKNIFSAHVPHEEVLAYGSRVNGKAHSTSDLDLVIRHPQNWEIECEELYRVQEAIRLSPLPILVDILDWARVPENFRAQIQHNHIKIFP